TPLPLHPPFALLSPLPLTLPWHRSSIPPAPLSRKISSIKPKPTSLSGGIPACPWGHHPEPPLASITAISPGCAFLSNVSVVVPSTAAIVIKALKEPERDRKKTNNIKHNGYISPHVVIEIAKVMQPRSMAKDFS
uniref:Large ribosomal subunit protein uL11 C-terminal domain-containing protein n=1 Tax=Solanum lycopersicum TaxID=4081 RepID=A0A3Q7G157_SOLLC